MTIIIFIIVLLVTVTVHEWGHFIVAKKSGMFVEEFGFGIPPRLWSKKRGETVYSINALPIGGFVKIAGENGIEQDSNGQNIPIVRQFQSKPWYLQAAVLVAGVVCNILLAFVLFVAAYTIGMPSVTSVANGGVPTVIQVTKGSPAMAAGLSAGDIITSVSVAGQIVSTIDTETIHKAIIAPVIKKGVHTSNTSDVVITYTRKGTVQTATVAPIGKDSDRKIGIAIEPMKNTRLPFFAAVKQSVIQIYSIAYMIWHTLATLVQGLFTRHASVAGLTGPIGLVKEVGSAATIGFTYLLAFTAAISVNLAVLNIMPFPALDGGRLVVVFIEAITRRKISAKTVAIIHTAGFAILLLLMIVLTVGDIRQLLS